MGSHKGANEVIREKESLWFKVTLSVVLYGFKQANKVKGEGGNVGARS